jgi:diacylglycerol diphosphate phosphatase/phosphatidate phosphatase
MTDAGASLPLLRAPPLPPYMDGRSGAVRPVRLVAYYALDWAALCALALCSEALNRLPDTARFYSADDATLKYPLRNNTVSAAADVALAAGVPAAAVAVANAVLLARADGGKWPAALDAHHALLGLLQALTLASLVTTFLKHFVGRLRPSALARIAAGDSSFDKSFCSGHTSTAFAGLGFAAQYMAGKAGVFSTHGLTWARESADPFRGSVPLMLITFFLPLCGAGWIAATRLTDYAHHPSDVNAGAMVGSLAAWLAYHTQFAGLTERFSFMARPLARLREAEAEL